MTGPTLLESFEDKALLGASFSEASWRPWLAYLAALDGQALPAGLEELYARATGRSDIPAIPIRESLVLAGRRAGKSRIASALAVYAAAICDWRPYLSPGETAVCALLASDRQQARVAFGYCKGFLEASPLLRSLVDAESAESITFKTRTRIEVKTASAASARGFTLCGVVMDELAHWRDEESSTNPATEVARSIRPGLSSLPGARLVGITTPFARSGFTWDLYRKHWARDDSSTLIWRASSLEMNPGIDPAIVAEALAEDPEAARAEWLAQFRTDTAALLDPEVLAGLVTPGLKTRHPRPGVRYFVALDLASGAGSDSAAMAVAHNEGGVAILDAALEWAPPFAVDDVVEQIAEAMRRYNVRVATSDRWALSWPESALRKVGVVVKYSTYDASRLFLECLPLLVNAHALLLDVPRLVSQLAALERRARPGRDQVTHPARGHDDLAVVTASALLLAAKAMRGPSMAAVLGRPSVVDVPPSDVPNVSAGINRRRW